MEKSALRKIYLEKRKSLSDADFHSLNDALLERIKALSWAEINYLHCFWPIASKREVDTKPLLAWLQATHPHVRIVLPQADFVNHTMLNRLYTAPSQLKANAYGIEEPQSGELISSEKTDRIFIPLLAFDSKGFRVGYGKGFYDRFLKECRPDAEFIGLSLFEATPHPISDTDAFDIRMHSCITPQKTYRFS